MRGKSIDENMESRTSGGRKEVYGKRRKIKSEVKIEDKLLTYN